MWLNISGTGTFMAAADVCMQFPGALLYELSFLAIVIAKPRLPTRLRSMTAVATHATTSSPHTHFEHKCSTKWPQWYKTLTKV